MGTFSPFWGGGWRWNEVLEFVGSRLNRERGGVLGEGGGVNGVGVDMFLLYFKQDTALAIQF